METGKTLRRRLAWIIIVVTAIAHTSLGASSHKASAAVLATPDAPSGTGYLVYVPYWYHTLDPYGHYYATDAGKMANPGGATKIIILDFGKQWKNPTTGNWGVTLTPGNQDPNPNNPHQSMSWVSGVAQEFIDGYSSITTHPTAYIAIGTNNGDDNWTCNETGSVDTRWADAGTQWGMIVQSLATANQNKPRVYVKSANDIEDWNGDFSDGWVPCGKGTTFWFVYYGYQSSVLNYDFGNEPYGHSTSNHKWTESESYLVANGLREALVLPEIYCSNGSGSTEAQHWDNIKAWSVSASLPMHFDGVTSSNGVPGPGGCPTYSYPNSWSRLYTVLNGDGYGSSLFSAAVSYNPTQWGP